MHLPSLQPGGRERRGNQFCRNAAPPNRYRYAGMRDRHDAVGQSIVEYAALSFERYFKARCGGIMGDIQSHTSIPTWWLFDPA
jgi:hypothetical protein